MYVCIYVCMHKLFIYLYVCTLRILACEYYYLFMCIGDASVLLCLFFAFFFLSLSLFGFLFLNAVACRTCYAHIQSTIMSAKLPLAVVVVIIVSFVVLMACH